MVFNSDFLPPSKADEKLCLPVIIGTTDKREKELVAVENGYRESTSSCWCKLPAGFRARGLKDRPKLTVGDGALKFWNALRHGCPD